MQRVLAVVAVVGLPMVLLACSSDDSVSGDSSDATVAEDRRASAEAVAAGLESIDADTQAAADAVAAGSDEVDALQDEIHEAWEAVEGTVQQNDPDAYITFEDQFALLGTAAEEGDAEAAHAAADTVSDAAAAYITEYPG
jgi:hypothetical protein